MSTFAGRRVLIVEDEMLIAAQLEEALIDLGCLPHAALRLSDALQLVEDHRFDAAFLDLNVDGELSVAVADILTQRRTPFVFMSGYTSMDLQAIYGEVPMLAKPFTDGQIARTLAQML